jgi:hypothetical protein
MKGEDRIKRVSDDNVRAKTAEDVEIKGRDGGGK